MRTAAVILAAGRSARFGSPKPLAQIGGRTMLERVIDTARATGLDPVIAVVGVGTETPAGVTRVVNDRPDGGLSRSLAMGLAAVSEADAAVILLADQPTVGAGRLDRLIQARGRRAVVAAVDAGGVLAPPVVLERTAFALVSRLGGDTGLRPLLARHTDLVEPVGVEAHAPDVDTPADLAALGEPCPGCGAILPASEGPTHAYIGASPACWAAYGELLAREFGDPAYGATHRHTADAYAAQHPGDDGRRQRQSVALHLIALCHWLEGGISGAQLTPITRRLTGTPTDWPWLTPPTAYGIAVVDVLEAIDADAHQRLVRRWAESVWQGWTPHHATVRRWAAEALSAGG